jgi:hypothetical protein
VKPVVLMAALASAPALVHAKSYEIIVLGGGKTEADAQSSLEGLRAKVPWMQYVQSYYPRVAKSDEFPGLNNGLYIAVLGLCAKGNGTDVKKLVKAVNAVQKGAYSKAIQGDYGDPCPPDSAFAAPGYDEKQLHKRIAKEPTNPAAAYDYAVFLEKNGRLAEASVFADRTLALDPKHEAAKALAQKLMVLLTD